MADMLLALPHLPFSAAPTATLQNSDTHVKVLKNPWRSMDFFTLRHRFFPSIAIQINNFG